MQFLNKAFKILKTYRNIVTYTSYLFAFLFGKFLLGPFLTSKTFTYIQEHEVLNKFIDVQGMIFDKIIASTLPLLIFWATILFIYDKNKSKIELINEWIKKLSFLGTSPGTLLISLSYILLGISTYFLFEYSFDKRLIFLILLSAVLIVIGILFKKGASQNLHKNSLLDKYAFKTACFLSFIAFGVYLYGIIADPYKLWVTINNLPN